jgi:shikimate kinase
MRQSGKVVWLIARPETILNRMSGDATTAQRRPSLTDYGPLQEIVQLLAQRVSMYRETAHLTVDTENRTPQELTAEILDRLDLLK